MTRISRVALVVPAVVAILVSLLPASASAQSESLRLGFLTVSTGPLAAGGRQMEEGINLFLKERNNTLAGRKVELIIADTAGQPALAKTKTQELVERDKVHVDHRAARDLRSARHRRLHAAGEGAADHADLGRAERPRAAEEQRLRDPRRRHRGAADARARPSTRRRSSASSASP